VQQVPRREAIGQAGAPGIGELAGVNAAAAGSLHFGPSAEADNKDPNELGNTHPGHSTASSVINTSTSYFCRWVGMCGCEMYILNMFD
jgi:hypothetical protein